MSRRTCVVAAVVFVCLLAGTAEAAPEEKAADSPTGTSDVPFYVSAKFKKVAKRAFRQFAVGTLKDACTGTHPLCEPLVDAVARAFGAAIDGDLAEVKKVLNRFFIDASVDALLAFVVDELIEQDLDPSYRDLARGLVKCVARSLEQQRPDASCLNEQAKAALTRLRNEMVPDDVAERARKAVEQVRQGVAPATAQWTALSRDLTKRSLQVPKELEKCVKDATSAECRASVVTSLLDRLSDPLVGNDRDLVLKLVDELSRGVTPRATDLARLLAVIAGRAQRPDIRVYLGALVDVVDRGFERGLFDPIHESLLGAEIERSAREMMRAIEKRTVLADGGGTVLPDAAYLKLLDAMKGAGGADTAKLDALRAAYEEWTKKRKQFGEDLRIAVIRRRAIEPTALADVLRRAADVGADFPREMTRVHEKMGYLVGGVRLNNFVVEYGTIVLAAAAIIDFARTGDELAFAAAIRATVLYGLGEVTLQASSAQDLAADPASANYLASSSADEICEAQELSDLISGKASAEERGWCFDLGDRVMRPSLELPPKDAVADRVAKAAAIVKKLIELRDVEPDDAPSAPTDEELLGKLRRTGVAVDDLRRAIVYLTAGDVAATRKIIARLGVDLLVSRVDALLEKVVGQSAAKCKKQAGRTSFFCGIGAACGVYVLLQGAYYPVADFLWAGGTQEVENLAERVYTNLLETKALDSVPLVLNVGLGVSSVWLDDDTFGSATLIDKIGIALYKDFSPRKIFEVGLFVGGFLDALVRTAADSGEANRYWILGLNAGWTRLRGTDVGFEVHGGLAMPFEFEPDQIGFVAGAAIVIPFSIVFDEED